jgi:Fic family protein
MENTHVNFNLTIRPFGLENGDYYSIVYLYNQQIGIIFLNNDLLHIIDRYKKLDLSKVIDYERFSRYSISHHSTAIEGSTLTAVETQVLLSDGITPTGKPLEHSLMVTDHHAALLIALDAVSHRQKVTEAFIQKLNAAVMQRTGAVYETPLGRVNAAEGEYRKGNVFAGNHYFVGYDKVPGLMTQLVQEIEKRRMAGGNALEMLTLSFDAHYQLVTIHPFYDGNGRTSRLLMNFLQAAAGLPLAIVRTEDKAAYIEALVRTRKEENINIFRAFMEERYATQLTQEMSRFQQEIKEPKDQGRGFNFLFLP